MGESFRGKKEAQLLALTLILTLLPLGCTQPASEWQPLNGGLRPHAPVLSLAVDASDPTVMYAGLYAAFGLYRSVDRGRTWTPAPRGAPDRPVYILLALPGPRGLLLAGTADGLYRSTDRGTTWHPVPDLPQPIPVYTLARDASATLYLGGESPTPFRSRDRGRTWEPLSDLPGSTAVLALAVSPRSELLLAGTDGAGLFLSRDRGQAWQHVADIGPTFVAGVWFAPGTDRVAYARTRRGLYLTTDGARTWRRTATGVESRIDTLAFDLSGRHAYLLTNRGLLYRAPVGRDDWRLWGNGLGRPGTVFTLLLTPSGERQSITFLAGTQWGLYRSADRGLTWQPVSQGPGYPTVNALVQSPHGTLYLAHADGVYHAAGVGLPWQPGREGLPPANVLSLVLSPADRRLLYAGTEGHGVYRSRDGGRTWSPAGLEGLSVPVLALDPTDPEHLYARVAFERVYESADGGRTWTARWEGMTTATEVISLALDPRTPTTLYAGTTDGLFLSRDGARTWRRAGPTLAGQSVFTLAVDPRRPGHVYAGATRGPYRSPDGGEHWERWGEGLEDVTVTALAFHPRRENLVYAGTKYRGVYRSRNRGREWEPVTGGLEGVSVNALLVTPDGRWLIAATPRGVYGLQVRE